MVEVTYADSRRMATLSNGDFPNRVAERSLSDHRDPLTWLRFHAKLCHRCNIVSPSLRYCVEMYGGTFKQYHGWYTQPAAYRLGVEPRSLRYIDRACPPELRADIDAYRAASGIAEAERVRLLALANGPDRPEIPDDEVTYWHNVRLAEAEPFQRLQRSAQRLGRKLHNRFENIAREEFGLRRVGEGWVSESLLHQIVARICSTEEIVRHHRPGWLEGLELDIFIPALQLGVEYQGQQHFHPIDAWGGDEALAELQKRDARKAAICEAKGVTLVAVDYTEALTEEHIRLRLGEKAR